MKVLLIVRPFVFWGGVERATAGLVAALVEHGYDVHLLTPGAQTPLTGVTVHPMRLPPLPATGRLLAQVWAARRVVARGGWDLVQSHERTLSQHVYRAGEGCHRAYLASREGPSGRAVYHRVVLALERRVFERTPRIVAIARAGKREIERLYRVAPARVHVAYNGVDHERFHPRNRAALGPRARAEAAIPAGAWTVLFVGTGFERKGLATALEAFAHLGDPDARLVVVGRGDAVPYRALAERLGVAGRVVWLGARPDIERWYATADLCVVPSRYEPFGNVHLEALASGVPVVTSTAAGGSEAVDREGSGAVIDPRDVRAVTAALERFRTLGPSAREEARAAARRAAEPFTFAAQVAALERVWQACSGAKAQLS